jgi:thiamine biosynthesis lipoprotein
MLLDLGGIAKGYAVDKAIESIKRKGIKAALVSIAGDIRAFGMKPGSKPWKVGIQNPRGEDVFVSLYLEDKAISTSGDYQRYFIKDGRRYHHILNPDTGYPASGVISVSVIAPEGYLADGLSTGVFVIGPEKGIRLLESLGVDGIIVDSNKKVFITDSLKGKINIEKNL